MTRRLARRQDAATADDLRVGEYRQVARGELHGDSGQALARLPCGHASMTTRIHHVVDPRTGDVHPGVTCPACRWAGVIAFDGWVPEPLGELAN